MSEVAKAAERLAQCEHCYPNDSGHDEMADARLVARWALPLWDETPADIPWLNGISREGGDMSFMHVRLMESGKIHLMAPGKSTEGVQGLLDFVSPVPATRGAVRMLCLSLGIPLKEPAEL